MLEENKRKEKLCMFFASDYHFEMITIPYINNNLENNKIIVVTENNLDDTVQDVLDRVNLTNEQKNKIKEINWKNNNVEKINEIKNENKKTIIFIKGKEKYIDEINKKINGIVNTNAFEIIDCYDINEVQNQVGTIVKKYNKILSTSGVEKLLK